MARFPSVGEDFASYRIVRQLGRGGMGVVFAAEHRALGRLVALKVLSPELAGQDDYRARFSREATVLARLDSPHVVQVLDHGEHDGCLFIATQHVAGGDLSDALRRHGPVPVAQAAQIAEQLAWALGDSHDAGVVHRDVKPSNVLLREISTEVFVYLCDFGIAQDREPGLTAPGAVAGTFAYLAPERLRGEPATAAADLYALGCVLFTSLLGVAPYSGSDVEIGMSHLNAPVPQVVDSSPVAAAVNAVLRRSMAKDPADRYPGARAMRQDLRELARLAAGTAHPQLVAADPGGPGARGPAAVHPALDPAAGRAPAGAGAAHARCGRRRSRRPRPGVPPRRRRSSPRPRSRLRWPPPVPRPTSPRRRTPLVVAGAVAAVVLVAGGVATAVVVSGSEPDDEAGSDPTGATTSQTTTATSEPTSDPTSEAPETSEPLPEPPPTAPTKRPGPQPTYPDVPAATGVRLQLGPASLRAPAGWDTIDSGIVAQGVGARDYADLEGYYSSVFLRRSVPGIRLTSIPLLRIAAQAAVETLDENDETITLEDSDCCPPPGSTDSAPCASARSTTPRPTSSTSARRRGSPSAAASSTG